MQLARLVNAPRGDTSTLAALRAKVRPDWAAERIAIRLEQAAILEAYVNRVPMGGNLYGVEAAARTYFGEPAADLDLAQASLLAAIPNDPARLVPFGELERAAGAPALTCSSEWRRLERFPRRPAAERRLFRDAPGAAP